MIASGVKRRGFLVAAGAVVGITTALAAQPEVDPALPDFQPLSATANATAGWLTANSAVRIGGAEHVEFIVQRFNELYTRTHPGTRFVFESKGTTSAIPLLTFDKTLFGAMGRAVNRIEATPYQKIVGTAPLEIRVAYTSNDTSQHLATSLAVYVHSSNPLAGISMTQLARVLAVGNVGGDYSHWSQLGLTGAWAKRAIHPYGTPEYTGFGDYLQSQHLGRLPLTPSHEAYSNTADILSRLRADPAGIAVAAIGLQNGDVRQLPIAAADGSTTTGLPQEVTDGRYPLGRPLYFYLRKQKGKPLDPLVREYMRLVLSKQGQEIIASQPRGYLPLSAVDAVRERAKLELAP